MTLITDEMRAAIGVESRPTTHRVEPSAIARFNAAIGVRGQDYRLATLVDREGPIEAPPTFTRSLRPSPAPTEFELPVDGVMDAGSEWTFLQPVLAGDEITVTTRLVDLFERTGRLGDVFFAVRENRFVNQRGELAVLEKDTEVYYTVGAAAGPPAEGGKPASQGVRPAGGAVASPPDAAEGDELPALECRPTLRQLVTYAAASGDFCELHYDSDLARDRGFGDAIVYGALKSAFLGRLITDWVGKEATLRELGVQYRAVDLRDAPLLCQGYVKGRRSEEGATLLDLEVWIEDGDGNRTTPGRAVVELGP